jgi:hypothetical protein
MSSFKFTGLAAGSAAGNSLRYEQVFTSGAVTLLGTLTAPTTIGVGAATGAASGAGISFPATQSASTDANTLDDYEEGTWTPVIAGAGTAGTQTYATQTGRYTKIGRIVILEFRVTLTAVDGATAGNMLITGLPFAIGLTLSGGGVGMCANVDFSAGYTQFGLLGNGGQSSVFCAQFGDNQVLSLLQAAAIQATTDIAGTHIYSI